jgi:cell division protein FtsI (penicillin-binding protein 3)
MPITPKNILTRLYLVAGGLFILAAAIMVKLVSIQMVHGDKYKEMALQRTEKMFTIPPNRGNLYSDDGSLLATSVSKYTIRFDAVTVKENVFEENVNSLAGQLSGLLQ